MLSNLITKYKASFAGLKKEIWYISIVSLINRSGSMVIPFIAIYLITSLDWTKTEAGIVGSCFGLGSLVGSYLGGQLVERLGAYRTMFFSLVTSGIAFIVMVFFKEFYSLCLWVFITSTLADTLRPATFTAINYFSNEDTKARAISLNRLAVNLGYAVGPAVGGFIISMSSYSFLFIVDGLTCIFAGIFLTKLLKPSMPNVGEIKDRKKDMGPSAYRDGLFMKFCFFSLLATIAFMQIISATPVFFKEVYLFSEMQVGLFFTLNGLLIFTVEMPIIKALEKFRFPVRLMLYGSILFIIGHLALVSTNVVLLSFLVYTFCISFGEIIQFPYIGVVAMDMASGRSMGNYMAAMSLKFSLAFLIAPTLGMYIVDNFGWNALWYTCAFLCLVSVGGFYSLIDPIRKESAYRKSLISS